VFTTKTFIRLNTHLSFTHVTGEQNKNKTLINEHVPYTQGI